MWKCNWSPASCLQDFVELPFIPVLGQCCLTAVGVLQAWVWRTEELALLFLVGRVSYVMLWSQSLAEPGVVSTCSPATQTPSSCCFPHGQFHFTLSSSPEGLVLDGSVQYLSCLDTVLFRTKISEVVLRFVGATLIVWCHSNKCSDDRWYHWCIDSPQLFYSFFQPFNLLELPVLFFVGRIKTCTLGCLVTNCP